MTPGAIVRIRPFTQWARNKVRQHGDMFKVLDTGKRGVLVISLAVTYKGPDGTMEKWMGWFDEKDGRMEEVITP
jgi:hypothetical protein